MNNNSIFAPWQDECSNEEFNNLKQQCIICCSNPHKYIKTHDYPCVSMKYAFKCNSNKCENIYAHNICLQKFKACPACNKRCKPYLYVETMGDIYFSWIFKKIQNNLHIYHKIKITIILLIISLFLMIFDVNFSIFDVDVNINFTIIQKIYIVIGTQIMIAIINCIDDFIKKYWLYNETSKTIVK